MPRREHPRRRPQRPMHQRDSTGRNRPGRLRTQRRSSKCDGWLWKITRSTGSPFSRPGFRQRPLDTTHPDLNYPALGLAGRERLSAQVARGISTG
jgi:hypothetical protein